VTIDLNRWHHQLHQTTGSMALRFNEAGAGDLWRWAEELHRIAGEMEAEADRQEPLVVLRMSLAAEIAKGTAK
jgi:endogenous inhibitor of DNA gyrase (YacG/DUF329 family)